MQNPLSTTDLFSSAYPAVASAHPESSSSPSPTPEDLMERYADGDLEAFDALYALLTPGITATLRRWLRAEHLVEDTLQTTLLKLHASRARYRRGALVLPWVLTIARNAALDHLRSAGARAERPLSTREAQRITDPKPPAWNEGDEQSVVDAVQHAISLLPPSAREVVRLHKVEGKTMAEIAELLGIREGTVRVRAHRGYRALADGLLRSTVGACAVGRVAAPAMIDVLKKR